MISSEAPAEDFIRTKICGANREDFTVRSTISFSKISFKEPTLKFSGLERGRNKKPGNHNSFRAFLLSKSFRKMPNADWGLLSGIGPANNHFRADFRFQMRIRI